MMLRHTIGELLVLVLFSLLFVACKPNDWSVDHDQQEQAPPPDSVNQDSIFLGADLSYVNEMIDCGGIYRKDGATTDPYVLFAEAGMNLIRLRLWHSPDWTSYSNPADVKKSIRKAKAVGAKVLLDFHYSDDWADPAKQLIPAAWKDIDDLTTLGDSLYLYTRRVLSDLYEEDLLPEMVQIGNETNSEILMPLPAENYASINWERNVYLFNRGLQAVRDVEEALAVDIQTMIHIAQPENALWWFPKAFETGIDEFDWIGLSYYPKWSEYSLSEVEIAIKNLIDKFEKRVMIVETAYPYSLANADAAANLLGGAGLIEGFPATPDGQKSYMISLVRNVLDAGGEGVIYWEPAWISTNCTTRWGNGSHWDNATFFDAQNSNEVLPAIDFFRAENYED